MVLRLIAQLKSFSLLLNKISLCVVLPAAARHIDFFFLDTGFFFTTT